MCLAVQYIPTGIHRKVVVPLPDSRQGKTLALCQSMQCSSSTLMTKEIMFIQHLSAGGSRAIIKGGL